MRAFGGRRERPDLKNFLGRCVAVVVIAENRCAHDNQRDPEDEDGFHDALTPGLASGDERNVAMHRIAFTPKMMSALCGPAHRIITDRYETGWQSGLARRSPRPSGRGVGGEGSSDGTKLRKARQFRGMYYNAQTCVIGEATIAVTIDG